MKVTALQQQQRRRLELLAQKCHLRLAAVGAAATPTDDRQREEANKVT